MQIGSLVITPDARRTRIVGVDEEYDEPAEYEEGRLRHPASHYVRWVCSDGQVYESHELVSIQ